MIFITKVKCIGLFGFIQVNPVASEAATCDPLWLSLG